MGCCFDGLLVSHLSRGMIIRHVSIAAIAAASVLALTQIGFARVKAPASPPAAPPAPSWTRFYVGGNIGAGWVKRDVSFGPNDPAAAGIFNVIGAALPTTSFSSSSALGGFQVGYNWQFNRNWLVGLETDFDWTKIKGAASSTNPIPFSVMATGLVNESIDWFGTVRARLGYLPTDNLLAYLSGGFAYGQARRNGSYGYSPASGVATASTAGGFSVLCGPAAGVPVCFAGAETDTATGWAFGGGFEYRLWQNWSFKGEYLYVSLASKPLKETAQVLATAGTLPASISASFNRVDLSVARAGFNYHF
jgi:outer membrane immunogenic protein